MKLSMAQAIKVMVSNEVGMKKTKSANTLTFRVAAISEVFIPGIDSNISVFDTHLECLSGGSRSEIVIRGRPWKLGQIVMFREDLEWSKEQ